MAVVTTAVEHSFRCALSDARTIIARRLRVTIALAVVTMALAIYIAAAWRNVDAVRWATNTVLSAVSLLCYADAMRLVLFPDYSLNLRNVLRLVALAVITIALIFISDLAVEVMIVAMRAGPSAVNTVASVVGYLLFLFFGARFAFACFALEGYSVFRACIRSWRLTGRPTFVPTLLLTSPYYLVWFIVGAGLGASNRISFNGTEPWLGAVITVIVGFSLTLLTSAFIFPFLARWMLVCERLHNGSNSAV